jgi:mono/diheme cytochrome c family protein
MRAFWLLAALLAAPAAWAQSPPYPQIERGRYLAAVGDCVACHTAPGGPAFAGGLGLATPFGTIYASNLTPDPQTGLGQWSEDDFWRALHEGRDRSGAHLYPAMPYAWTTRTTRADSDAIFAYLRTLPPVVRAKPANDLYPPLNFRVSVTGWNLLFFTPEVFKPDPHKSDAWNRGAYLVTGLGHCGGCHTPLDVLGAAKDGQALQGNTLDDWYAPNITNDRATGLGGWQADEIVAYLQTGRTARAIAAGPMADVVMHSTQFMTSADLHAIATYLKSEPGAGTAPAPAAPDAKIQTAGAAIYRDNCTACHGAKGMGAADLIPSLPGDGAVVGTDPVGVLRLILHGGASNRTHLAVTDPGMPAFGWKLSDAEVAAVATYIRTNWGNHAGPVGADTVRALREHLHDTAAAD